MEQTYCIYKITNQINGKAYIGFTKNFMKRMWGHQNTAQKGVGQAVHAAIRKYGWENFTREELYYSTNKQHTLDMEDVFINLYETKGDRGYNITRGGQQGPPKGYVRKPMTEEQLIRLRDRAKDPETRRKISEKLKGNKNCLGRHHVVSEEARIRMKLTNKGKYSDKQRAITSECMKGNQYAKGHVCTGEQKQKISTFMRNRDHSYKIGRKQSPETVEKKRISRLENKRKQEVC